MTATNNAHSGKRLLSQVVLTTTALAIFACFCARNPDKKSGESPGKVTIACATLPEAALAQVAQSQGYYREEGLEATVHLHPYGKLALKELLEGKADFATVAETPVMFAAMKGEKIAVIGNVFYTTFTKSFYRHKFKILVYLNIY